MKPWPWDPVATASLSPVDRMQKNNLRFGWWALLAAIVLGPANAWGCEPRVSDTALPVDRFLQGQVGPSGYPGAVSIVSVDDEIVLCRAYGYSDLGRSIPMRTDAIFRIYSMTKPVVSAAVLRLVGEGHARLDDPVAIHLPVLAGMQVMDADGSERAPIRMMTIRHLLTHTAGFPVSAGTALSRREAAMLEQAADLVDYVGRLEAVPLETDPGQRFAYDSIATEVLGRLVEVWSGQPLDDYLEASLFIPLGMVDTAFEVATEKRGRIVELGTTGGDGRWMPADESHVRDPGSRLRPYTGAAGGLYSTAGDYLAFARMLLSRGSAGGRQLVPKALVDEMFREQLTPMKLAQPYVGDVPGRGFGLGISVLVDPSLLGRKGAAGQAGWSGAASTYFVVDPSTQTIGILMLQYLPSGGPGDPPGVAKAFYDHVQEAVAP